MFNCSFCIMYKGQFEVKILDIIDITYSIKYKIYLNISGTFLLKYVKDTLRANAFKNGVNILLN